MLERATLHAHDNVYFLKLPVWNAYDTPGSLLHIKKGEVIDDLAGPDVSGGDENHMLNGFYGENASFFDDIRNGIYPKGDLQSAQQSVEIAQATRARQPDYSW